MDDFLSRCNKYELSVNPAIRRRNKILLTFVQEDKFRLPRNSVPKILEAWRNADIKSLDEATVHHDMSRIKLVYLYLRGTAEDKHRIDAMLARGDKRAQYVAYFKADNIRAWEQLQNRGINGMRQEIEKRLAEEQVASQQPSMPLTADQLLDQLRQLIDHLEQENKQLTQTNQELAAQHQQDLETIKQKEEVIVRLQADLRNTAVERVEIALSLIPEYADMYLQFQQREGERRKKLMGDTSLFDELPKQSTPGGLRKVIYQKEFRADFVGLPIETQKHFVQALKALCNNGQNYQSLRTKRIEQTKDERWYSRASDKWRFTWRRTQTTIEVLELFPKGNDPYRMSES